VVNRDGGVANRQRRKRGRANSRVTPSPGDCETDDGGRQQVHQPRGHDRSVALKRVEREGDEEGHHQKTEYSRGPQDHVSKIRRGLRRVLSAV